MMSLEDMLKERMKQQNPGSLPDGTSLNSTLLSRSMGGGIPRDSLSRVMGNGQLGFLRGDSQVPPEAEPQPQIPDAAASNESLRRLAKKSAGQMP